MLLVEDNPAEVRLITEAIKDSNLENLVHLDIAFDGEDALAHLANIKKEEYPDLILLDLNLPRVTGKEVLKVLKSSPEFEQLVVFIVTNSDNKSDIEDCYQLNADAYFQKPTEYNKLVDFFKSLKESMIDNSKFNVEQMVAQYDRIQVVH